MAELEKIHETFMRADVELDKMLQPFDDKINAIKKQKNDSQDQFDSLTTKQRAASSKQHTAMMSNFTAQLNKATNKRDKDPFYIALKAAHENAAKIKDATSTDKKQEPADAVVRAFYEQMASLAKQTKDAQKTKDRPGEADILHIVKEANAVLHYPDDPKYQRITQGKIKDYITKEEMKLGPNKPVAGKSANATPLLPLEKKSDSPIQGPNPRKDNTIKNPLQEAADSAKKIFEEKIFADDGKGGYRSFIERRGTLNVKLQEAKTIINTISRTGKADSKMAEELHKALDDNQWGAHWRANWFTEGENWTHNKGANETKEEVIKKARELRETIESIQKDMYKALDLKKKISSLIQPSEAAQFAGHFDLAYSGLLPTPSLPARPTKNKPFGKDGPAGGMGA